jgi:hypothetical protein
MSSYFYSISTQTANGSVLEPLLLSQITSSAIVTTLIGLNVEGDLLTIRFASALSGGNITILNGVVAAHQGLPTYSTISTVSNLTATTNPTVTDDGTKFYDRGSVWLNQSTGDSYMMIRNTTGAAVWKNISSPYSIVTDTNNVSTTSGTYIVIPTMTITPGAGTYFVSFNTYGAVPAAGDGTVAIHANGTLNTNSVRVRTATGNSASQRNTPISTTAIVTVGNSQAIDVRYFTTSNFNLTQRNLIIIKLSQT